MAEWELTEERLNAMDDCELSELAGPGLPVTDTTRSIVIKKLLGRVKQADSRERSESPESIVASDDEDALLARNSSYLSTLHSRETSYADPVPYDQPAALPSSRGRALGQWSSVSLGAGAARGAAPHAPSTTAAADFLRTPTSAVVDGRPFYPSVGLAGAAAAAAADTGSRWAAHSGESRGAGPWAASPLHVPAGQRVAGASDALRARFSVDNAPSFATGESTRAAAAAATPSAPLPTPSRVLSRLGAADRSAGLYSPSPLSAPSGAATARPTAAAGGGAHGGSTGISSRLATPRKSAPPQERESLPSVVARALKTEVRAAAHAHIAAVPLMLLAVAVAVAAFPMILSLAIHFPLLVTTAVLAVVCMGGWLLNQRHLTREAYALARTTVRSQGRMELSYLRQLVLESQPELPDGVWRRVVDQLRRDPQLRATVEHADGAEYEVFALAAPRI